MEPLPKERSDAITRAQARAGKAASMEPLPKERSDVSGARFGTVTAIGLNGAAPEGAERRREIGESLTASQGLNGAAPEGAERREERRPELA